MELFKLLRSETTYHICNIHSCNYYQQIL